MKRLACPDILRFISDGIYLYLSDKQVYRFRAAVLLSALRFLLAFFRFFNGYNLKGMVK